MVELFVLLEQDILWLEVAKEIRRETLPMDDVVFVTVVDTRKHLLHEDCSVFLAKLAARENFVEQFAALADPLR